MQRWELLDGGLLLYHAQWAVKEQADHWLHLLLQHACWEQRPALFGHPQPRLTASYGDAGLAYRYSQVVQVALPWLPVLQEIRKCVQEVAGEYNYCLLNRYRNGADSMGWHADDERELGPVIASVSLGATRGFRLRHNCTRQSLTLPLEHGSLLIMSGTTQRFWQHAIPKTKRHVGERINLTFRQVYALPV